MIATRRTFIGTTLLIASAVALPRFSHARSSGRTGTIKAKDGIELFVKDIVG